MKLRQGSCTLHCAVWTWGFDVEHNIPGFIWLYLMAGRCSWESGRNLWAPGVSGSGVCIYLNDNGSGGKWMRCGRSVIQRSLLDGRINRRGCRFDCLTCACQQEATLFASVIQMDKGTDPSGWNELISSVSKLTWKGKFAMMRDFFGKRCGRSIAFVF